MKEDHINEIRAIIVLALAVILLASLVSFVPEDLYWYSSHPNIPVKNLINITGAYVGGALLFLFGYSAYFIVGFLFFWSWNLFTNGGLKFSFPKLISCIVLLCVISSFFSLTGPTDPAVQFDRAGLSGLLISNFLVFYLGRTGTFITLLTLGVLALILTGEFLVTPLFFKLVEAIKKWWQSIQEQMEKKPVAKLKWTPPKVNLNLPKKKILPPPQPRPKVKEALDSDDVKEESGGEDDQKEGAGSPKINIMLGPNRSRTDDTQQPEPVEVGEYKIPSLDLLEDSPDISTDKVQSDLLTGAKTLEDTLNSFGVGARVADIERGPAITRYELEPAPGVKVQKFTTLSDDIALAMRAATVRVVAPIPGKSRVGIEVPNSASAAVFLKDVLSSDEFRNSKSKLTLSLGKDIAGKPMVADLAEMPHLLIAGTTGSGKTVCVNGIIMSVLLNATPQEVRFVMIDPKMVEMAQYNDIPHLLCPTVTDSKKAVNALNWVVGEMEARYKKLSKAGLRNIKSYHEKNNDMPYIIVVIDELADLMQVAGKGVESSICRLAQLSRAVGIHLILATQRPSVNVITGVIKANFPARISFKVASKIDSRTVLDTNGAETLLGKGDMLFMKPGDAKPTRGQGNYVRDEEIHRVIDYIKGQQQPIFNESIMQQQAAGASGNAEGDDPLFDEAVRMVIETNQASVSILQRRMRLGYTRAARLIDLMEQHGIVGPYVGSKPRDILVDREQWLLDNAATSEDDAEEKSSPAQEEKNEQQAS